MYVLVVICLDLWLVNEGSYECKRFYKECIILKYIMLFVIGLNIRVFKESSYKINVKDFCSICYKKVF